MEKVLMVWLKPATFPLQLIQSKTLTLFNSVKAEIRKLQKESLKPTEVNS
jgi:hypothetical protein